MIVGSKRLIRADGSIQAPATWAGYIATITIDLDDGKPLNCGHPWPSDPTARICGPCAQRDQGGA